LSQAYAASRGLTTRGPTGGSGATGGIEIYAALPHNDVLKELRQETTLPSGEKREYGGYGN